MTLAAGDRLGAYAITAPIGAGGMGEVYRARDTRLERDVAIKIVPEPFAADPDRVARFEREARTLAALNHPNIAHIYGLEDGRALVMELVPGETLADRIARGPLPLDEALPIARQIADALEAAHEQGIIHRDLKPANIKVRDDGTVKVLDFGLAKLAGRETPSGVGVEADLQVRLSDSPTITSPALTTGVGVLLGTAAYMSPEQAKGRPADKRSDIWAFGCVLYEMLTGQRAFEGSDVADTLASVLKGTPDWTALPAGLPAPVPLILVKALERNRTLRLGDISAARFAISTEMLAATGGGAAPARTWTGRTWTLAATFALVAGVVTAVAIWNVRPEAPRPWVSRYSHVLAEGEVFTDTFAPSVSLSRDGTQLAYVANQRVYLRSLSDFVAHPIAGTETQTNLMYPTFSPDGREIAFWVRTGPPKGNPTGEIRRISTRGGTALPLARIDGVPFGIVWEQDAIWFAQLGRGILRLSADGSEPELVVPVNASEIARGVQVLPPGDAVLFTVKPQHDRGNASIMDSQENWDDASIVVHSLTSGERTTVVTGTDGRYLPTGHLLFARRGVMFAVPFDPAQRRTRGSPVPVLEGVLRTAGTTLAAVSTTGGAHLAISETGTVAYVPGPPSGAVGGRQLAIADRAGTFERVPLPVDHYESPRISPDGTKLAVVTNAGSEGYVSIYDLSGTTALRRLTFDGNGMFPVWSTDGRYIVYQSNRSGRLGLWRQREDGSAPAEQLTSPDEGTEHRPGPWFPDGRRFLYTEVKGGAHTLWEFSLVDRRSSPFHGVTSGSVIRASMSPDGRWVAYTTAGSEASQVFLRSSDTGAVYLVSSTGRFPRWSPSGRELFYVRLGQLWAVAIGTDSEVKIGNPEPLARDLGSAFGPDFDYDVLPDGRFIGTVAESSGLSAPQVHIGLNWFEELKRLVPTE